MKIYYDTEFLEDGRTIDLISIGMVASDGREYYAVNQDAPWSRIRKHPWLMANVVPHLPRGYGDWRNHMPKRWLIDFTDSKVKPRDQIADEVYRFLVGDWPEPELWAWYAAYDHVALAQLWGRMIDLPQGVPMWTNDIQQEIVRLSINSSELPPQKGAVHNALEDARYAQEIGYWLKMYSNIHPPAQAKEK